MDDLAVALAAARAGAAVVREAFGDVREVTFKGTYDPVTATDRASESAVLGVLRAARPDDAILAEESGGGTGGRSWIVDPLDGTVNFVHGIPHLSVSVALWDGAEPLVGVVVDPLRDEEFTAATGVGTELSGRPVSVSPTDDLASAVIATGFPYDHDRHADGYGRNLAAVLARVNGVRRFGSAALDLAWVACGRFDGYWELHVAPWDQAAGIVLVREAGGLVTDLEGEPATPTDGPVVAATERLHASLLDVASSAVPDHVRRSSHR